MKIIKDRNSPIYDGLPYMRAKGDLPNYPFAAEIKYNGELHFLVTKGALCKENCLANKQKHGTIKTDMPLTDMELPEDSIFIGELIYDKGKEFLLYDRNRTSNKLRFAIHSIIKYKGNKLDLTCWEMRKLLEKQTFYNYFMFLSHSVIISEKRDFKDVILTIKQEGYEGLVLKSLKSKYINGVSTEWAKIKFQKDCDLVIVGFEYNTVRCKDFSLLLAHKEKDRLMPITFCSEGLSDKIVRVLSEVLNKFTIGKKGIGTYYPHTTIVSPKIVVTVEYESVIRDNCNNVISLLRPKFKCFRLDKNISEIDTLV